MGGGVAGVRALRRSRALGQALGAEAERGSGESDNALNSSDSSFVKAERWFLVWFSEQMLILSVTF